MRKKMKQLNKKEKNSVRSDSVEALFCYLAGVYSLAIFLASACRLASHKWFFYLLTGCFAFFLWWLHRTRKNAAKWFDIGFPFALALLVFLRWNVLYLQVFQIRVNFVGTAWAGTVSVLEAVLYGELLLAYLVFLLEMRFRKHIVWFLLNTVLLLFLISWRIEIPALGLLLLLIFQFASFSFYTVAVPTAVLLIAAAYLIASMLVPDRAETLFQGVYDLESSARREIARLTRSKAKMVSDGKVSRENNYQTGASVMEVRVSELPDEILYLKGYTGGSWENDEWQQADETELREAAAEAIGWNNWSGTFDNMLDSMYYNMSCMTGKEEIIHSLKVHYLVDETDIVLAPYFGIEDTSVEPQEGNYYYTYIESADVQTIWNARKTGLADSDWYYALQNVYYEEAAKAYTQVPAEELPKLSALLSYNQQEELKGITAFILSTLESKTSYTLTPGRMPSNENIMEYFLFERQQGYCVHYASTAVMMYRLYGIPARYASGYSISPGEFVRQEDGSYLAVVTDESAHAWAEIFLEDYGWVPIEVTPSAYPPENVYPGLTREEMEQIAASSQYLYPQYLFEKETGQSTGIGAWFRSGWSDVSRAVIVLLLSLLAVLLLAVVGRHIYCCCRRKKMDSVDWYRELMRALWAAGKRKKQDYFTEDFPDKLSRKVKAITLEQAQRLEEILNRITFSQENIAETDEQFVKEICCTGIADIRRCSPWYRRAVLYILIRF